MQLDRDSLIRYFQVVVERASESLDSLNPLFAGRCVELARLHENVRCAVGGEIANRTVVVHGAPGAGKSELRLHFLHQLSVQNEFQVVPVAASVADVGDAKSLMRRLLSNLSRSLARPSGVKRIMNEIGSLETMTIAGTGNSRKVRESQPESTTQYTQFDWFRTQANKLPSKVKEKVFVLCVDEFQGLQNPRQSLCQFLHQGDLGLKIVPVFFGLSDAPDVLQRANVSRLLTANSIALGSLSAEASKAILLAFWEGLKIDFSSTSSRDRVIAEAAARCDHWPQRCR